MVNIWKILLIREVLEKQVYALLEILFRNMGRFHRIQKGTKEDVFYTG